MDARRLADRWMKTALKAGWPQFIEEMGDRTVESPLTGKDIQLRSLDSHTYRDNADAQKILNDAYDAWLEGRQEDADKDEERAPIVPDDVIPSDNEIGFADEKSNVRKVLDNTKAVSEGKALSKEDAESFLDDVEEAMVTVERASKQPELSPNAKKMLEQTRNKLDNILSWAKENDDLVNTLLGESSDNKTDVDIDLEDKGDAEAVVNESLSESGFEVSDIWDNTKWDEKSTPAQVIDGVKDDKFREALQQLSDKERKLLESLLEATLAEARDEKKKQEAEDAEKKKQLEAEKAKQPAAPTGPEKTTPEPTKPSEPEKTEPEEKPDPEPIDKDLPETVAEIAKELDLEPSEVEESAATAVETENESFADKWKQYLKNVAPDVKAKLQKLTPDKAKAYFYSMLQFLREDGGPSEEDEGLKKAASELYSRWWTL